MQHGDEGRAREWMIRALRARRDPAWTADGFVSERWLPVSPVTGRLDAFEWKDPLAGDDPPLTLIEAGSPRAKQTAVLEAPESAAVAAPADTEKMNRVSHSDWTREANYANSADLHHPSLALSRADSGHENDEAPANKIVPPPVHKHHEQSSAGPTPVSPGLIPLVHAPDDPGPEAAAQDERGSHADETAANNWTRIRQLFR
jgi:HemY protein